MPTATLSHAPRGAIATRAAVFQPASFNEADNSVELVWTTGATVRRYDWLDGEYDETLATGAANVRLDRLNGGAPLLANHDRHDLGAIVGSVIPGSARMVNGQGVARVRFADTPDVADIVAKVRGGHIRSISAGYIIHAYEVAEGDGRRSITVVDWEPIEVSLVAVPADKGSYIRSEDHHMPNSVTPPADASAREGEGAQPVTTRAIMQAARNAGLDIAAADELLDRHEREPLTRAALMAEVGRRFEALDSRALTNGRVPAFPNPHREQQRGMEDAIFCRMSGRAPDERAREFMGLSLSGMARHLLEQRGENARMLSDIQIIERSLHTTSDFPNLLLSAGNRYLMETFEIAASAIKQVARERTANDFRDIHALRLSNASALSKVNEAGEVTHGTFSEGAESYRLFTFAKIFAISRQALINDDLGAFADPLRLMARAAAETEATELAGLLTANSGAGITMGDGKALYHADHGNKATSGGAVAVATLGAGLKAMRDQKDIDGKTPVNAIPKYLLAGTDQEVLIEQFLTQTTPATPDQVNPFVAKLTPLIDPRLPATAWRLFADPALMPVLEYAYLNSAKGPQLETKQGWEVLGQEFRVVLDFGCGAVDHRGTYLNAGA